MKFASKKGRGIPQSFRAFARVLCSNAQGLESVFLLLLSEYCKMLFFLDLTDLHLFLFSFFHLISELSDLESEAAQSDGRLARSPLKNKSREIEAHELIHSKITEQINEYDAFIKVIITSDP